MTDWLDAEWEDEPVAEGPVPGQIGVFGDDNDFKVAWQEWKSMPEFAQNDLQAWGTCVVKFRTPEDRQVFAELIGQPLRGWRAGAGIWFPAIEIGSYWDKRYRDASAEPEGETI